MLSPQLFWKVVDPLGEGASGESVRLYRQTPFPVHCLCPECRCDVTSQTPVPARMPSLPIAMTLQ